MAKKKAKKKVAKKPAKKTKKKVVKKAARKPTKKAGKKTAKKAAKKKSTAGPTTPLGGIIWSEVHTNDPAGIQSFYSDLFGWQKKDMPMGPGELYRMLSNKGVDLTGVVDKAPGSNSTWINYISVKNVDAVVAKAEQTGGKVLVPPMDIPQGRFAILQDPGGAPFGLFKA